MKLTLSSDQVGTLIFETGAVNATARNFTEISPPYNHLFPFLDRIFRPDGDDLSVPLGDSDGFAVVRFETDGGKYAFVGFYDDMLGWDHPVIVDGHPASLKEALEMWLGDIHPTKVPEGHPFHRLWE